MLNFFYDAVSRVYVKTLSEYSAVRMSPKIWKRVNILAFPVLSSQSGFLNFVFGELPEIRSVLSKLKRFSHFALHYKMRL